jgi:phosphohistidine phosphatase
MKRELPVQIYLLRHGIAEDGRPGISDAERALTGEGMRKLRGVLKMARAGGLAPSLILASPLRRAVETAEIAAKELGYSGNILRTHALTPESSPEAVWDELRGRRSEDSILLAGHEPLFSTLTAYLLGAPSMVVDFKKGALVRIDVESFGVQPRGALKWMLTARLAGE